MGAKVKGIGNAISNLNSLVGSIASKKIARAMHRALDIGGRQAAIYTPIDTKTLINSQFRDVKVKAHYLLVALVILLRMLFSFMILMLIKVSVDLLLRKNSS